MSDDLISRQDAIDAMEHAKEQYFDRRVIIGKMQDIVANLPTAVVHARWIWVDGVRCSNCNHKLQTTGLPSFCPNCGAQMEANDAEIH